MAFLQCYQADINCWGYSYIIASYDTKCDMFKMRVRRFNPGWDVGQAPGRLCMNDAAQIAVARQTRPLSSSNLRQT